MKNSSLYLPGFHLATLRRKPRSAQQMLTQKLDDIRQKSFSQLGECFSALIPPHLLKPTQSGALSRRRVYSKENTFWAFFSQLLDADGGCQEAVRKLQSHASASAVELPSSGTSAYCQARQKLELDDLEQILEHTSKPLDAIADQKQLNGRRVVVVDGTGLSMPDTKSNQQVWPQQRHQMPGCGFPQAALCACFDLHSSGLLSYRLGNKQSSELPMLRQQRSRFKPGDIFLGDKGFCSYLDLPAFKARDVDSVVTLARRKPVSASSAVKVLGDHDRLIDWHKPKWNKSASYTYEQWESLPERLTLRQIRVVIAQPGFRGAVFHIVTTLLDPGRYPADQIADLYRQRWEVELFLRDIKTTLGMDLLRCKTPAMIRKEIVMYWIVYNCIRWLMLQAATGHGQPLKRVSFKASVQALRQWEPMLYREKNNPAQLRQLLAQLRRVIAAKLVPDRPDRGEPRVVKRRPKSYQLMTRPRAEMVEVGHRGKYGAEGA